MAIEATLNQTKRVGIVVGGGPAPGINGTIGAVTLEAGNRGHEVIGIYDGFSHLMAGRTDRVKKLDHDDVSRIHFEGGSILATSRANPTKNSADLARVVDTLKTLGICSLVTIGGDDTMYAASQVAKASAGQIRVCHVPRPSITICPCLERRQRLVLKPRANTVSKLSII
jgi:6-phosphofructokinase 1